MLIKAGDGQPLGRLTAELFFYLTWLRKTRPLTWPADIQGIPCCQYDMAVQVDNKEVSLSGSNLVFSSLTSALTTVTPASLGSLSRMWVQLRC